MTHADDHTSCNGAASTTGNLWNNQGYRVIKSRSICEGAALVLAQQEQATIKATTITERCDDSDVGKAKRPHEEVAAWCEQQVNDNPEMCRDGPSATFDRPSPFSNKNDQEVSVASCKRSCSCIGNTTGHCRLGQSGRPGVLPTPKFCALEQIRDNLCLARCAAKDADANVLQNDDLGEEGGEATDDKSLSCTTACNDAQRLSLYDDCSAQFYDGQNYTAICEVFECASNEEVEVHDDNPNIDARCVPNSAQVAAWQRRSDEEYFIFYACLIGINVAFLFFVDSYLVYVGWKFARTHITWLILMLHARLTDMMTDWGFLKISIKTDHFAWQMDEAGWPYDTFSAVVTFSTIAGTVLWLLDMILEVKGVQYMLDEKAKGGVQAREGEQQLTLMQYAVKKHKRIQREMSIRIVPLVALILEDLIQIVAMAMYFSVVGELKEMETVAVVSVVGSAVGTVFNIMRAFPKIPSALQHLCCGAVCPDPDNVFVQPDAVFLNQNTSGDDEYIYLRSASGESSHFYPGAEVPKEMNEYLTIGTATRDVPEIPAASIKKLDKLGVGNFGTVWKGEITLLVDKTEGASPTTETVAIKTVNSQASFSMATFFTCTRNKEKIEAEIDLVAEAHITDRVRNHANVVSLVGIVGGSQVMLVMEFCEHGSLVELLKKGVHPVTEHTFSHQQRHQMLLETADGMDHLANNLVVHRDLSARNVLVTRDFVCKVADFGLSRVKDKDTDDALHIKRTEDNVQADEVVDYYRTDKLFQNIPVRWTAPEAATSKRYSEASDVWSWGVLAAEILVASAANPYERPYNRTFKVRQNEDSEAQNLRLLGDIQDGLRPISTKPEMCSRGIYKLLHECWSSFPRDRPTFKNIVTIIGQQYNPLDVARKMLDANDDGGIDGNELLTGAAAAFGPGHAISESHDTAWLDRNDDGIVDDDEVLTGAAAASHEIGTSVAGWN